MPAYHFLSDEDLALILTYIRQNFGNNADPVSEEEIKSRRPKTLNSSPGG
jgi:mono/diheme cytochrome c family protein